MVQNDEFKFRYGVHSQGGDVRKRWSELPRFSDQALN